jgi:outer membrane protein TolC
MRNLIIIIFLALSQYLSAQDYSLKQAIDYAYSNSTALKINQIGVVDAEAQIEEYKSIGKPKVSASLGYQYFLLQPQTVLQDFISPSVFGILIDTELLPSNFNVPPTQSQEVSFVTRNNLDASVDASWQLFDGSYLVGLEAAKLLRELTGKEAEVDKQNIRASVTRAYLGILIAEENRIILQKNEDNARKTHYEVKAFYDNGLVESLDVTRASLSIESQKTQKEALDFRIKQAYDFLKFSMGYPMEEELTLSEDLNSILDKIAVDEIVFDENIDYTKRAEYANIELGQDLNRLNLERVQKQKLPVVTGFASVSETLQRNNIFSSDEAGFLPAAVAGISVNYNIYDGGNRTATEQRMQLAMEKTELQKRDFERGMEMQIRQAQVTFNNARNTMSNAKKTLELTQEIYDKTYIKYKEGVGSSLEVSQAEAALYGAQSYYINTIYDVVLAKTELDIATGEL